MMHFNLFVQISSHHLVILCRVNRYTQIFSFLNYNKKLNIVNVITLVYFFNLKCLVLLFIHCLYSNFLWPKSTPSAKIASSKSEISLILSNYGSFITSTV